MIPWEAVFWAGLALLSPALARPAWPQAVSLLGISKTVQDLAERLAPWLWGIVPAYLALITGAVPARFFGLTGQAPLDWVGGAILSGALIGLAALIRWPEGDWAAPTRGILDEPRWALYRAVGILWLPRSDWGLLLGLAIALLEWGVCFRPWQAPQQEGLRTPRMDEVESGWSTGTWETVARIAGSSLLFAITRNFWVTALSQAVFLGVVRKSSSRAK